MQLRLPAGRSARDAIIAYAVLAVFLLVEIIRGASVPPLAFAWIAIAAISASFAANLQVGDKARTGGWGFAIIGLAIIYISALNPIHLSWQTIIPALHYRLSESYIMINIDALRFRDVYMIIASAAFTLFGLLFVATRGMDGYIAVRVVAMLVSLGSAFLMAASALLFQDEAWWRLVAIAFNSSVLLAAAVAPKNPIANYIGDHPAVIDYWENWLKMRRGWALLPMFGLTIIPVDPVFGEALLCLGLLFQVWLAASGASTLYILDQVKSLPDYDSILRNVLLLTFTRRTVQILEKLRKQPQGNANVTKVFLTLTTPPTATHAAQESPEAG